MRVTWAEEHTYVRAFAFVSASLPHRTRNVPEKTIMASPNNNNTGDAVQSNESDNEKSVKMCPELKEFYTRHGVVDAEDLLDANGPSAASSLRFIRLNPRYDKEETLRLLEVCWHLIICIPSDFECSLIAALFSFL